LTRVRARIARAIVPEPGGHAVLGTITLRPHQREIVERVLVSIRRHRGALVADDVGSGKTFIALAVAARFARPLVVAPAVLRHTWDDAANRAHVTHTFVSVETLGRGRPPPGGHDLIVVDEAHHLRNPRTLRHRAVRGLAEHAGVVLLSGTPVHNSARDLDALLSLFLGADARDFTNEARAEVVVRSEAGGALPEVIVHTAHAVADANDVTASIDDLPPMVAPRDGALARALFRCSLLRAWCSSAGALEAMARRAFLSASAFADALSAGVDPTKRELAAWGGEQVAMLFERHEAKGRRQERVEEYLEALARLRACVRARGRVDDERAETLLRIASAYPGVPVLACTQYAATVGALWRRLRQTPGVCALTAHSARIATGTISRADALAMFAPAAQRRRRPHERERISLLITTDLVSEGLNLQDAGVVVHLDLPWTAARLAQRVGRVARSGSPHAHIHVHSLAPPRAAGVLLALERRIARKRRLSEQLAGGGVRNAALLGGARRATDSPAEARARIIGLLSPFAGLPEAPDAHAMVAAAVSAPRGGWIALVSGNDGEARLVTRAGAGAPRSDPLSTAKAVAWLCRGEARQLPPDWRRAAATLERWIENERARSLAGAGRRHAAREHVRTLTARMGRIRGAPSHARARTAHMIASGDDLREDRPAGAGPFRIVAVAIFVPDAQDRPAI
jgi:superfamily II DNA or RNA helicase